MLFLWDWILFFIWTAVFAWFHHEFPNQQETNIWKDTSDSKQGKKLFQTLYDTHWVDLVVMLLFLVSAIMGPICFLMERRSLFASRASYA